MSISVYDNAVFPPENYIVTICFNDLLRSETALTTSLNFPKHGAGNVAVNLFQPETWKN